MGCGDILLCIFLPFLASGVRERGCGMMLLVFLLSLFFYVPGIIAAFILTLDRLSKRTG